MIGQWRNFQEMEDNLSLDELIAILDAHREDQYQRNKFLAAIQGIDLEGENNKDKVEEIKLRVRARQAGMHEDDLEVMEVGFGIEEED